MSQQLMPIVSIVTPSLGGIETLSNMLVLAVKEFKGKVLKNEGTRSTVGDLCTITAGTGKILYLGKAKVSVRVEGVSSGGTAIIELKAGAVGSEAVIATYSTEVSNQIAANLGTGNGNSNYSFTIEGISVPATENILLEVTTLDSNVEVNGEIIGWQEDSAVNPLADFVTNPP